MRVPTELSIQLSTRARILLVGFGLTLAVFFFLANRAAYQGFFTDDDFDNIANARESFLPDYLRALIRPSLGGDGNFRAAAYFYYFGMVRVAGLRYRPYIAGIHVVHLINIALVWALARALGAAPLGACAAAFLFVFHAAAFSIYWTPMYVFDLLCGTFTLASVLAYIRGRMAVSLIFFWLAMKSKEVAVLLPVLLATYELLLAERRWKRVLPFAAISAIFGIPALISNTHRDNDYTLRFTIAAIRHCASFYASQLLLMPFAGFALLAIPFVFRNRLVRLGAVTFLLFLAPLLVLPGRLFAAYLYVPLIGVSIALSAVNRAIWLAAFFAAWMPWNYYHLRLDRRAALASARERRTWFAPIASFMQTHPDVDTFVYENAPESLAYYGVAGAVRNLRNPNFTTRVAWAGMPQFASYLKEPHLVLLAWDQQRQILTVVPRAPDVSYINLSPRAPIWQLISGWQAAAESFRWIEPHARARLLRPANAHVFEVVVYVSPFYIEHLHQGRLALSLDHVPVGSGVFDQAVPTTFHFEVPPGPEGSVEVEFTVAPPLKDPSGSGYLGIPIAAFGFASR